MPNQARQLDHAFRALSEPTRRAVIEQLTRGPQSVTGLARKHKMALPSFSQHLQLLENAGLVSSEKQGRARIFSLNEVGVKKVENWLNKQRALWEKRLDQLDSYLKTMNEENI
jgi:DNA-binding transcriptional ArsR family regulator